MSWKQAKSAIPGTDSRFMAVGPSRPPRGGNSIVLWEISMESFLLWVCFVWASACVCAFEDGVVNFAEIVRNDLNGGAVCLCAKAFFKVSRSIWKFRVVKKILFPLWKYIIFILLTVVIRLVNNNGLYTRYIIRTKYLTSVHASIIFNESAITRFDRIIKSSEFPS